MDLLENTYRNYLAKISSLSVPEMRQAVTDEFFRGLTESRDAVWILDQILRGAVWGDAVEMDAMLCIAKWLIDVRKKDDYMFLKSLFEVAIEDNREGVLFLLRDPPNLMSLKKGVRLPEARLPIQRDTTLGERRTMGRTHPSHWKLLLSDPSPLVLREVLRNPRLKIEDVQSVASRRPSLDCLIDEIVANSGWIKEMGVREAIVLNPFTRTGTALRFLPTLNFGIIHQIARAGTLHESVLAFSKYLIQLRDVKSAPVKTAPD